VGKVVPCDDLIHPAFLSSLTMTPQTICKSILKLHEVSHEQFSNIQTKKGKHLPNLTDKSSKNNQAFYFIFQKCLKTFIIISILFYIILHYFMLHYFGGLIRDNGIAGNGMHEWVEKRNQYRYLVWTPKEGASFKDLGTDGRILCKQIFRKQDVRAWTAQLGSGHRQMECHCNQGNELSGSTKCGQFLDWLRYVSITRTPFHGIILVL